MKGSGKKGGRCEGFRVEQVFINALPFQSKCKGQDLFDQIMYHIDLVETDYFGLQFMDTEQVSVSNKRRTFTFTLTDLELMLFFFFF